MATSDAPDPSSKRTRKKLEKQEAKKRLKQEHHAAVHVSMLQSARTLRDHLQQGSTAVPDHRLYTQLPRAGEDELFCGACDQCSAIFARTPNSWSGDEQAGAQARASRLVDQFLWRPHLYNVKYASQELSLLYQLFRLGGQKSDLVVDIGGGNANLSCLIALVLDVPVVCVEMESPRPELRGEAWLPEALRERQAVTRVESLIQDYSLPPGYEHVLVLGKHLCGPGTDAGIDFVARHLDRIMGCCFATCCCCKLVGGAGALGAGLQLFAELYFVDELADDGQTAAECQPVDDDDGGSNSADGQAAADAGGSSESAADGVNSAAITDDQSGDGGHAGGVGKKRGLPQWTGLTGSSARRLAAAASKKAAGESEGAFLRRVLPEICRATSWRNQAYNAPQNDKYSTASYPEMLQQAEFFESWIQGFRRRRLASLFGDEEELLFCNESAHSQQNRCLVSGRWLRRPPADAADGPGAGSAHGLTSRDFFALLEAQLLKYAEVLPVDLRVRGVVSAKYEHDGTAL